MFRFTNLTHGYLNHARLSVSFLMLFPVHLLVRGGAMSGHDQESRYSAPSFTLFIRAVFPAWRASNILQSIVMQLRSEQSGIALATP